MSPEESYAELLALVESERERRCAEAARRAQDEERGILSDARREARRRARAAFDALREQSAGELRAARAELETARRRVRLAADRLVAERGFARLEQELRRRWSDPAARRAWIAAALECASRALREGSWTVGCPARLDDAERRSLEARPGARLAPDESLAAGIRVEGAGACVDATLGGLLEDRRALEARLLGEVEQR
jgi:hypothetical protein